MTRSIPELDRNFAQPRVADGLKWYDIRGLTMEGQGWSDDGRAFSRLPAKAEGVVRPDVWELGQHSAGLCARFITDSPSISARWDLLRGELAMAHMPATGVSGLDLYIRDPGAPRYQRYAWIGVGQPTQQEGNESQLVAGLAGGPHEFVLYLPLYNGAEQVEIAVEESASLEPAPPRDLKPIVIYGTSIVQGGCAARPGMAYTSIIGRTLDWPVINLGFSGNGQAEPEVARLLAEIDPAAYVLDYCPNNDAAGVAERTEPFVRILREARPDTPIVLVENVIPQRYRAVPSALDGTRQKNAELRAAFERLLAAGVKHLLYVPCENLFGHDTEGTVDGIHPTDVGFQRMAATIGPVVEALL